jgi:serine/threonine protein kinase
MFGGRILGKGTYGCIYQPALKCRSKKGKVISPNSSYVGKITSKKDAENELAVAKALRKSAGSEQYTVVTEAANCTPRAKSRQVDTNVQKCDLLNDNKLEDTIQLLMPWGGNPLSRINLDPYVFDYFRFCEEILACGAFLVTNNLCHFDIWGQNFLFDRDNKPRLIDFGFTFQPSQIEIGHLIARWRVMAVDHDTESPEVTLMQAITSGIPVDTVIRGLQQEKPAVLRLASFCDVDPREWAEDLAKWTSNSKSFQQNDWLTCWKLYWPGFDAWSIGAVLLQVLEIQLSIPAFAESKKWNEKGNLIKSVLKGLTRANPVNRMDAAEALSALTNGAHPLISYGSAGSEWVLEKKRLRQ